MVIFVLSNENGSNKFDSIRVCSNKAKAEEVANLLKAKFIIIVNYIKRHGKIQKNRVVFKDFT